MNVRRKSKKFHSVYAHEFDNTVILVHNIIHTDLNLQQFYTFIFCIVGAFVLTVAFSKIFRMISNEPKQDISRVALDTLGSFLATNSKAKVNRLSMRCLQFSIGVFSILFSIFVSAFLLGLILDRHKSHNINRLNELATANLRIFITFELNETIDQWSQNLE